MTTIEQVFFSVARVDGSVAILGLVTRGRGSSLPRGAEWLEEKAGWWRREPTDAVVAEEIARAFTTGPAPTAYRRVEPSDIPTDRTYRDALTDDGVQLKHDMPRAREIHLRRVRAARGLKLAALDREWMKAEGKGDKTAAKAVEDQRQVLRNLPATLAVDGAETVETLKAKWSPLLDE